MQGNGKARPRILYIVYRGLLALCLLLIMVIVSLSIYALLRPELRENRVSADQSGRPESFIGATNEQAYFTGMGKIRARSAEPDSALVIISVVFPYDTGDLAFTEELSVELKNFRELTVKLASEFTADELRSSGEERFKSELLRHFNALLRLGRIEHLYFPEFLVID